MLAGKPVAERVFERLKPRLAILGEHGVVPGLAVILAGDDPASAIYVRSKTKAFQRLDLRAKSFHLPASVTESEILELVDQLNADSHFHGMLVQLPLPLQIDAHKVLAQVSPLKDVDGFHPENLGMLLIGKPRFIPCTPQGILELLDYYDISAQRRHAVVVGRSTIVGKPMMALLANKWERGNATVTLCHTGTPNLGLHTRQADLLIVASGQAGLVRRSMVQAGVDIIDVGMNRIADDSPKGYHLVGDVDAESVRGHARALTPVPGGVGPMTVAMLVRNTVLAAEISIGGTPTP